MRRHLAAALPAGLLIALTLLDPLAGDAPAPVPATLPAPAEVVADQVRAGQYDAARFLLEPAVEAGGARAEEATVLLGMIALQCERPEIARDLLLAAPDRGRLADWRRWALADSLAALGEAPAALAELAAIAPSSPLRPASAAHAAELAAEHGDPATPLELAARARLEALSEDIRRRLAIVAWEAADSLEESGPRRTEAARLLAEFPIEASKRKVIELFRQPDGGLDWPAFMTVDQLRLRARRLLDANLDQSALHTLEQVPVPARDSTWELLLIEALIENHRGVEARQRLTELADTPEIEPIQIEWLHALAALDASEARRGRRNLPETERAAMREQAVERLHRVARDPARPTLAVAALRNLLRRTEAGESVETALPLVRSLRGIDPGDYTGVDRLWRLGWEAFEAGDKKVALRAWEELLQLEDPWTAFGRAALYWSGRAHQALGNEEQAAERLGRVAAAPFEDFYRPYAVRALGGSPPPVAKAPPEVEAWPDDPVLDRARLLTDHGLDASALIEIGAVAADAEPRARYGLEARVLARLGRRRESIDKLRRAFPTLGSVRQDQVPADALRLYYPLDFAPVVEGRASARSLSSHLVLAMIRQESAFDARAESGAGARGLMQLMPATGRELARQLGLRYPGDGLVDPEFSVELGTAYFRQMLEMFGNNELLALAGYNAGPYRIRRLWRRAGDDPELDRFLEGLPLRETRIYVKRVLLFADSYRQLYG